eukprot:SAG11_NODE_301_length_11038_cov_2.312826_6_plen_78_part_00
MVLHKQLVKSDDLDKVLEVLKKYNGWKGVDEQYSELEKWKEELVGQAKAKLLALCGSTGAHCFANFQGSHNLQAQRI